MSELFQIILDPDAGFIRKAFIASLLASIAFGVTGTYVVVRRIGSIAGAISHSALGGIGAAIYFRESRGWQWLDPLWGALVAALLSAWLICLVHFQARQREDTIVAAIWSIGMAVGFLFLHHTSNPADLMSYLQGHLLLMPANAVSLALWLSGLVLLVAFLFHPRLAAICFDPDYARLRGIRVERYYLLLLSLTAVCVVLLVSLVGLIMVMALLVIPPAIASPFSRKLSHMMALSVISSCLLVTVGLGYSISADLPSGPVIVLLATAVFLLVLAQQRWGRHRRRRLTAGGGDGDRTGAVTRPDDGQP